MSFSSIFAKVFRAIFDEQLNFTMEIKQTGFNKFDVRHNGFKPRWIILHHSWSPDHPQHNDWAGIKQFHTSWRYDGTIVTPEQAKELTAQGKKVVPPWHSVGYQFGIERVAGKVEVFTGRRIGEIGAHAVGFNTKSIGICVIGNYDLAPPDADHLFVLSSLCRQLQREFKIPKDCVVGHSSTFTLRGVPVEKSCPGKMFDLALIQDRLLDVSPT